MFEGGPVTKNTEQQEHLERFSFVLQARLIGEFVSEGRGSQEEWVDQYAELFRQLFPSREQAWKELSTSQSHGFQAIQQELDQKALDEVKSL